MRIKWIGFINYYSKVVGVSIDVIITAAADTVSRQSVSSPIHLFIILVKPDSSTIHVNSSIIVRKRNL